jgi:hypothetical protein
MSRGGAVSILGGIAVAACLMLAPTAGAATLTGDYQFQGTTASSGPGPVLTSIGGIGFQTDTVMGVSRQVVAFPKGAGLQMTPTGVISGPYSVVMTFRLDNVGSSSPSYRRILDPYAGTSEIGLYSFVGRLSLYGNGEALSPVVLSPNTYATVVMVMAGLPVGVKAYFNGAPVAQLAETFDLQNDTLRFFKDNGTEESGGAVSCIRVFSGALTDAEVAAIGANPRCGPPFTAAPACKGKPATIVGTEGKDVRKGTSRKDVIVGLGGNDKLSGLAGNDVICGGSGKDTLNGGKGNDKLYGEAGKDTLKGGPSADKLNGGAGKDKQIQ